MVVEMFHTDKTTMTLGTAIAAIVLLFASWPIVVNQQALAANLCGSGFCERDSGISYPSPLSHYFGGDVLHHHHGNFHYHNHGSGFHHFHHNHHNR